MIQCFMLGEAGGVPKTRIGFVDVRDVAEAHKQALLVKEAKNQRFILVSETLWEAQVSDHLFETYKDLYEIKPTPYMSYLKVRFMAFYNADAKKHFAEWGQKFTFDNSETEKVLGIKFKDWRDTLFEMVEYLIKTDFLKLPPKINYIPNPNV